MFYSLDKSGGMVDALDSAEYSGSLIILLNEGVGFVKRNMKTMWKKTANSRIEMPEYCEPQSYVLGGRNHPLHINSQKKMLENYAEDNNLTPYLHFTDDGISGTRFDRPGFVSMLKEVNERTDPGRGYGRRCVYPCFRHG